MTLRGGRVTRRQMSKLLELLTRDAMLNAGSTKYISSPKQHYWRRLAHQLNAIEDGAIKSGSKWCKMLADWKTKTKKKADAMLRDKRLGLVSKSKLTELELRLLKAIGYPLDDLENEVVKMHPSELNPGEYVIVGTNGEMVSTNGKELPNVEYINEEQMISDDNIVFEVSEEVEENKDELSSDTGQKETADGNKSTAEIRHNIEEELSSDSEERSQIKDKNVTKTLTVDEHKNKVELELERQKVQQKTEELKIRALELKLKGEELRLKEMEINKINYLTNIEEEKLKCFREISASLKELLDRSSNGNRFPNLVS